MITQKPGAPFNGTEVYEFKVRDYTTILYGQKVETESGFYFYTQRGDGLKFKYDDYRIVYSKRISRKK